MCVCRIHTVYGRILQKSSLEVCVCVCVTGKMIKKWVNSCKIECKLYMCILMIFN